MTLNKETMTDNEKYYTPEIEEFHVGFEYEEFCKVILDSNGEWYSDPKWVKKKVDDFGVLKGGGWGQGPTDKDNIYSSFTPFCLHKQNNHVDFIPDWNKHIRVKRLDHDDIVECGWDRSGDHGPVLHIFTSKSYTLKAWINIKMPMVEIRNELDNVIFYGSIPNKSVLKQVMKLIGIQQ